MQNKKWSCLLGLLSAACLALSPAQYAQAAEIGEAENMIFINEIESSDADGGNDWVEIINAGTADADIGGWYITDDKGTERVEEASTYALAEGTTLKAGEVLVLEETIDFDFGLGKADTVTLWDATGSAVDSYSWSGHATGTYSRSESGEFVDQTPTKGAVNVVEEKEPEDTPAAAGTLVINEVNSSPDDWVELMNTGDAELDLSGFELRDNSDDHRWQFPAGSSIGAGALLVVKADSAGLIYDDSADVYVDGVFDEAIGIGSGDSIRLYDARGDLLDSHSWTEHANIGGDESASWGRYPDGSGSFALMPETPGAANSRYAPNVATNPVVVNEVQSNDPDGGPDWIELANPTGAELDISGLVIRDDDDSSEYVIPEGTSIPANGFLVISGDEFGFGLGKNDTVRLFEGDLLIGSTTWSGHTNPTWGLYPDVNGSEYANTAGATPGAANRFAGIPDVLAWPGDQTITASCLNFLEDSSGLDFHNGQLYAVDNGSGGRFWILDVAADGTLSFAEGFENGKTVNFASHASAKGPDTEGITVDGDGYVYLASERDNSNKGVNSNVILKADPRSEGAELTAMQEWDLTAILPDVAANTGIEAVEWAAFSEVAGKLYDQNTNTPFDHAGYPDAVAGGVFFVALEDNGHVYAFILNSDGSSVRIADLDPKLGGAMALDYDTYEHTLWVVADDGYGNMAAKLTLTGGAEPEIVHIAPPSGLNAALNNEGFAIADPKLTVNGRRPVFRFTDGVTTGALTVGSVACDYAANPFDDVISGEFYCEPVLWAYENGVTTGRTATLFGVGEICTRGEFVTFLWRAAGKPAPVSDVNPFGDVQAGQFYTDAVLWAYENGITTGLSASVFGTDEPCTRDQVVTFLWRAAGEPVPAAEAVPFADVEDGKHYTVPVLWAYENQITTGISPEIFGVGAPCTREQVVTFLYRAAE